MQLPFLQRVHVLNTITTPSQSLLNELQTVEVWSFTLMLLALCAGLYCFLCFGLCLIFAVAVPVHPTCSFLDNRCTNMLSIFSWRERTSSLVHILLANPIPLYVLKCSYLYHVLWTQKTKSGLYWKDSQFSSIPHGITFVYQKVWYANTILFICIIHSNLDPIYFCMLSVDDFIASWVKIFIVANACFNSFSVTPTGKLCVTNRMFLVAGNEAPVRWKEVCNLFGIRPQLSHCWHGF